MQSVARDIYMKTGYIWFVRDLKPLVATKIFVNKKKDTSWSSSWPAFHLTEAPSWSLALAPSLASGCRGPWRWSSPWPSGRADSSHLKAAGETKVCYSGVSRQVWSSEGNAEVAHTRTLSEWYVTNRVQAGGRVRWHAFVTLGSLRDGLTLFQSPRLADAAASWICPRPWRGPSAEPRPPPGCRHSLFGEPRVHSFFYSRHPKNRGHGRTESELSVWNLKNT